MRIFDIISEKRKNPEQNTKESVYDFILKYADDENTFLHTTSIEKVGINPNTATRTSDDTPAGIYTFQIKSIKHYIEQAKEMNKSLGWVLPYYGGDNAYILKSREPLRDMIRDYSNDDLYNDIEKLKTKFDSKRIDKFFRIAPTNENFINAPVGYLWGITKAIAVGDPSELSHQQYPDPMVWNKVLRFLGHSTLVDEGYGWIHAAESNQALFLDSSQYDIIDHMKVSRKQNTITIGGNEYKGGRLPKEIHLKRIDDTEISNVGKTTEAEKVKLVTIERVDNVSNVMGVKRVFPNADVIVKNIYTPDMRKLLSSTMIQRVIENIKIVNLIFTNEFPVLPTHIAMLDDIEDYIENIRYTEQSIDSYGRQSLPQKEKFSPKVFKKIKPAE